jgi:hypothetical protein
VEVVGMNGGQRASRLLDESCPQQPHHGGGDPAGWRSRYLGRGREKKPNLLDIEQGAIH